MLDSIHTAIVARLSADIPALATCAAYPRLQRKVSLPAVLVELDDLDPVDFGTERFDCWARFTAYCIYDPTLPNAELEVRKLAATVAVRVSQEADFGEDIERVVEVLRVGEDSFKAELESYLVWAVEFQLGLSLGENEWSIDPAAGVSVTTITVGDLDSVYVAKQIADGSEPAADDEVSLPGQPKG